MVRLRGVEQGVMVPTGRPHRIVLDLCDECGHRGPAAFELDEENPHSGLPPLVYNGGAKPTKHQQRPAAGLAQILLDEMLITLRLGVARYGANPDAVRNQLETLPPLLKVDCWFGAQTAAATRVFQTFHGGLQVDGKIGPKTWTALLQASDAFRQIEDGPVPEFPRTGPGVDLTAVAGLAASEPPLLAFNGDGVVEARVRCARTYTRASDFAQLVEMMGDAEVLLATSGSASPDPALGILRGIYYGTPWSADYAVEQSAVRNLGFKVYAQGFVSEAPLDPRPSLLCGLFEALQSSQDATEGTRQVDFGHLLIGLEARQNGRISDLPGCGHSGLEAATWLGDLGGGAAMLAFSRISAPSARARGRFSGTDFGGSINLEGDIAGYVVARDPAGGSAPSRPAFGRSRTPIADALRAYFAPGNPAGSPDWQARSRHFLVMYGGSVTRNSLANRSAVVATFKEKIEEFGAYYLVNRLRQTSRLTSASLRRAAEFLPGAAQEVAEIFTDALVHNIAHPEQQLRAVTNPPPTPAGAPSPHLNTFITGVEQLENVQTITDALRRRLGL